MNLIDIMIYVWCFFILQHEAIEANDSCKKRIRNRALNFINHVIDLGKSKKKKKMNKNISKY